MKLKHLLAATAMAVAFVSPAGAEEIVPYTQFTLANGLKVVVHEDHKTPKVAVAVWYHVGSMNEPEGKSGFAHLYEHLMFNGSENHNKEYFPPLQEIGTSGVNGATSLDQTYYYEIVPTGGLERALWLESDRMGHMLGAIDQAKLDEQRKVVQNEKRQRDGQPYAGMTEREQRGLFPVGHPYYHTTIGSMEDLNAASLDDVKAWFTQYYGASNAVVSLSGDVTVDQARKLMEKYFGSVPAGPPVARVTSWVPTLTETKTDVMEDAVPQVAIAWDWPVPGGGTAENPALDMAARVLGRGKMARLNKILVRDRQLATNVTVNYQPNAIAGIFSIQVVLKDGKDRAEVEKIIADVLADYMKNGPTPEEMKRHKVTSYSDMVRSLESIYVKAMALADGAMFHNDPGQYVKDQAAFEALTAGQARTVAAEWLSKPSYRLTVLPYGEHGVVADGADRKALPALGPSPSLTLPAVQEAKLNNGIRVLFSKRPGAPTVEMTMAFDAGHAAEQHMKPGLGGFTLGLMDEGTKTLTSSAFSERSEMLGARIYAYGDQDTTDIQLSALTRALPESVALWADYVRNPGFRQEDLERDRSLSLSGLSQSLSDPNSIAQRTYSYLIYGKDHAYGAPLAGRADVLRSFTRDDVIAFHDSWMRPDNAVIYAAGDIEMPVLLAALNKGFGDWTPPARPKGEKSLGDIAMPTATRIVLVDKPGAPQSVIRAGQPMPSSMDPREFDIDAMNGVLGGNFTSRINMNIREDKGWAYGATSGVGDARGPRAFTVATSVQTDKTAEAMTEILKEVRGIGHDHPATQAEIDLLTKGEVLALPGKFETNQAMVGYMQYVDRMGRPYEWITTLPEKYAGLTPDTITRTAGMLHPDALTWVVVGDLSKIEAKVRALNLGTVEIWDAEGKRLR